MSTFEDMIALSRRRRLFSGRIRRRRRLRGRHILGGVLIAGAVTAALSVTGHRESSPTLPQNADVAPARFSTVQKPVEQILAEPQAATAAPIELPSLLQPAAAPAPADAASPASTKRN